MMTPNYTAILAQRLTWEKTKPHAIPLMRRLVSTITTARAIHRREIREGRCCACGRPHP